RQLQTGPGCAGATGAERCPPEIENRQRHLQSLAERPENILLRHRHVAHGKTAGRCPANPELLHPRLEHREPGHVRRGQKRGYRGRIQLFVEHLPERGERRVELRLLRGGDPRIGHRPIRNEPPQEQPFCKAECLRPREKQLLRLFDFLLPLNLRFVHKLQSSNRPESWSRFLFWKRGSRRKSRAQLRGTKSWIPGLLTTDILRQPARSIFVTYSGNEPSCRPSIARSMVYSPNFGNRICWIRITKCDVTVRCPGAKFTARV